MHSSALSDGLFGLPSNSSASTVAVHFAIGSTGHITSTPTQSGRLSIGTAAGKIACFPSFLVCTSPHPLARIPLVQFVSVSLTAGDIFMIGFVFMRARPRVCVPCGPGTRRPVPPSPQPAYGLMFAKQGTFDHPVEYLYPAAFVILILALLPGLLATGAFLALTGQPAEIDLCTMVVIVAISAITYAAAWRAWKARNDQTP